MAPPLGSCRCLREDYLVEEAQKALITKDGQEALEPLANENDQEA